MMRTFGSGIWKEWHFISSQGIRGPSSLFFFAPTGVSLQEAQITPFVYGRRMVRLSPYFGDIRVTFGALRCGPMGVSFQEAKIRLFVCGKGMVRRGWCCAGMRSQ
jgi:hypothetical protein